MSCKAGLDDSYWLQKLYLLPMLLTTGVHSHILTGMIVAFFVIFAYLLGSVPVGLLIAKAKGADPRKSGSGNIGATNVMRTAGVVMGIITLLGDVLKGFLPVYTAIYFDQTGIIVAIVGLAVFAGHIFPLFLKFRGGKGVATAAGIYLAIHPPALLISVIVFLIVMAIWRYVSLGSLIGTGVIPFTLFFLGVEKEYVVLGVFIVVFVFIRHKTNISRLIAGTENKITASH